MDELGSGTDPNQGVAIAQAILEALLSTGSRVAITTHYLQLKQLAAADNRFSVAAMQFINGKPTYKLLPGIVGESFALSVAERLKLPQSVIDRASELMDSDTKQMGELIRNIEDQKSEIDKQYLEVLRKKKELESLEEEMKAQKRKLEREQINARRTEAAKFAKRLEEKEKIIETILQTLKNDPSKKMIVKSWDEIKYVRRDAFVEAENVPSALRLKERESSDDFEKNVDLVPIAEMRNKPDLEIGQTLIICKEGPLKGKEAVVVTFSGKKVDVTAQGVQLSMKLSELALPPLSFKLVKGRDGQNDDRKKSMSKMTRKALEAEKVDFMTDSSTISTEQISSTSVMRLSSNTVDCLGCSFEEARRKCEDMFSKVMTNKHPIVFILHGHGAKGILKTKIREWLGREKQFVKKFGPADASDGGDAFTKVELKNSLL
jgi:DNA mismatch repair protein MutS2